MFSVYAFTNSFFQEGHSAVFGMLLGGYGGLSCRGSSVQIAAQSHINETLQQATVLDYYFLRRLSALGANGFYCAHNVEPLHHLYRQRDIRF